jgi:hypothetical protein
MSELTRRIIDRDHTRTWVARGPDGAIALHAVKHADSEFYIGLGAHRIHTVGPDVDACNVLDGQPCEVDALSDERGRDLFELRADEGVVFAALEREYARVWPGGGRCGESVPQAGGTS